MIADLRPYAEYKESGLPWLGQVPGHWEVVRSKRLFSARKDLALPDDVQLSATQAYGVIPQAEFESKVGRRVTKISMHLEKRRHVEMDDFVISMRSFQGGLERAWSSGAIRSSYVVLKPAPVVNAGFFSYLLKSHGYIRALQATGDFIRDGQDLTFGNFCGVDLPLIPPAEQAAIVRFLDWANGRLERAIRAKRKVIALLGEQKQAIIHGAVTRGLDPSVPLKPSGIPWLGDIPQHWEVSRVKNEFRCLNTQRVPLNSVERGAMTARTYDYYGASGVIDKVDDYLFDDELLLIAEDGANLVLRNLPLAIIARGQFWVNNHAHILKPKRGSIAYLAHVLETLNYKPWISGAAQPKLTQDRLMSISIAVAPPEEQAAIVEHTSEQTRPLVTAISRLEREIELLREYRTRLVADVVTGKLDVRGAATRLPDEAPLDTVEDDSDLSDEPDVAEEEAAL
ncbi:MAG: restriction endonuclease subunit S [Candidatus Binatia bacterium]